MAADYCTLTEVKDMLADVDWDTSYDITINPLITRASRLIDKFTNREPAAYCAQTSTRLFDGNGKHELFIDELAGDPDEVYVKLDRYNFELLDKADYYCIPVNALIQSIPYNYLRLENGYFPIIRKAVKIKGKFGSSADVPEDIKQACIMQVVRWFKHGQQAFQNTAANNELGTPQYGGLDDSITSILQAYRKFVI
jgi:hypothetical protein